MKGLLGIDRRTNTDILLPISASTSVPDDAFLRQRRRVNTPPTDAATHAPHSCQSGARGGSTFTDGDTERKVTS